MSKQASIVDWEIAQDDTDWEHRRALLLPDMPLAANGRLHRKRSFWSVAVLLLLLVGVGDWWWRTTQAALPQPTAAITATAQPKQGAVASHDSVLVTSVIRDLTATDEGHQVAQEGSSLRVAIQPNTPAAYGEIALPMILFRGEQAVVSIVTTATDQRTAYRQTRFYRHTDAGWLRTDPDAALWGPEGSLETPSFIFHFRQNDAQAVIAIAPQVDALYTTLRRHFGLPLTPGAEKLIIEVSVTWPPGQASPGFHVPDRFRVPSPAVYWAPVAVTDAELLAQSIALPLLNYVLAQASKRYQIGSSWQPMMSGLRLWQMWDMGLPLSAWREEVVKWLYSDLPGASSEQQVMLPDHYEGLCAAHTLWMPGPVYVDIPILCNDMDRKNRYQVWGGSWDSITRLDQLAVPAPQSLVREPFLAAYHPGQTVALATLVEYTVATYGRERLPALVAGLGQYESWDTLLPAVFGVSVNEFEAGWQTYLTTRYGS